MKALFFFSISLLIPLLGCSETGVPREAVSGHVTLDGQPLPEGTIQLQPLGEGPSAGGKIQEGRYELSRNVGPSPGKYRIDINAWKESGRIIRDEAMGTTEENLISIIPPKYNLNSTLEINVEKGGNNQFDFDLVTTSK